ncbi:hypothetical protein O7599_03010 [Streptomyces sp. WMMC500]|uniref:hypothetical protein n=1 Tax=Streptomyces sp. WMMC500 TaxID=3015154 RepID=UPI00248B7562|nr:hypothetical protein [Streptomyces sp. WMMC500]WBB61542.1 hypothetical protein O7599_03010 [Streptomyces sp. WMMC500]
MPVRLERLTAVGPPEAGHGGTTAADLSEYADDLETVYGPLPDRTWLDRGERVSYADLVTAAADVLGGTGSGVDLLLTVTPVPDCQARVLPGCLLAELLGGRPLVIGVNDQGAAGPFTALRLARGRIAGGEARRAAVVVMEQSTLPPEPGYALPPGSGAVVVVLGADSGADFGPDSGAGPARRAGPGSGTGLRLAELTVRRLPAADRRPPRPRPAGWLQPWYEAALRHAADPGRELAVADRDEALGYDCLALFTPVPAAGAGGFPPEPVVSDRLTTPFLEART